MRTRQKVFAKNDEKKCRAVVKQSATTSSNQEMEMCATAACDRDCELSKWGEWGECSKGCVASSKEASWQGRERGELLFG